MLDSLAERLLFRQDHVYFYSKQFERSQLTARFFFTELHESFLLQGNASACEWTDSALVVCVYG